MIKLALIGFGVGVLYFAAMIWFLTNEDTKELKGENQWKNLKR